MKFALPRVSGLIAIVTIIGCQDTTGPAPQLTPSATVVATPTLYSLGNHTCALTTSNVAYCWGRNQEGQIGIQTNSSVETTPQNVLEPSGVSFVGMGGGNRHTCGVTSGGLGYCWGENGLGQLGTSSRVPRNIPRAVTMPAGVTFSSMSSGNGNFQCALSTTGAAYCWGDNSFSQMGTGGTTSRLKPYPVRGSHSFTTISTGFLHTCAVDTGGAGWCWGNNATGRLGVGNNLATRAYPYAVRMPAGVTFTQIAAGRDHSCGLSGTGLAYCWGDNTKGQVGVSNQDISQYNGPRAVRMPTGVTFTQISAGDYHTCALGSNAIVYCWGWNVSGQIGNNTPNDAYKPVPVQMPGGVSFASVSAKYLHSCAMSTTNQAYCWGVNTNGEVGDGTQFNRDFPVPVTNGSF